MTGQSAALEQGPLRILVADDHPLFRQGLVQVLNRPGFVLVGEAKDGKEAVEKVRALRPHVVLMDVNMPGGGGLEATLRLQAEASQTRVLILTVSDKEEDLFQAIRFGARGYLLKDSAPQQIVEAVLRVASGEAVISPSMAAKLLEEFRRRETATPLAPEVPDSLTPRETEVLGLVATGASNQEIAATLVISENTVRTHLKNILEKLHLKNRSQAAAYAARLGLSPWPTS